MNKKIVVFICILSLLVPFLPSFDLSLKAYPVAPPSVSDDGINKFFMDIVDSYQTYFGSNGVVVNSDWYNYNYPNGLFNDICDYLGFEPIDDNYLQPIYDYSVNYHVSANQIFNDSSQYIDTVVNSLNGYFVYQTLHRSDLVKLFAYPSAGQSILNDLNHFNSLSLPSEDSVYFCTTQFYGYYQFNSTRRILSLLELDRSLFDDTFCYFTDTLNSSDLDLFDNEHFYNSVLYASDVKSYGFYFADFDSALSSVSCNLYHYNKGVNVLSVVERRNLSEFRFMPLFLYGGSGTANIQGGFFIVPDSMDKFSFPFFKSYNDAYAFYNGDSTVYHFTPSVSIPQGADIDYSRLYDIISSEVSNSSGNVIDSINGVANKYLQAQLDLLHDINNALNDGVGNSWLRRIYDLLDFNFPLTLQAFDDLQQAIQNISISGGGSDLSHINRVLDEINNKLGFIIEEPLTDADIEDIEDLKNLAQQKFPFCVFSDIVAISVILNQTPEQPHWQIPLKLPGSSSVNNIEVDLSWYENVRDLVQGVFIFIFIVGLLALSVKIFSALKS